VRVLGGGGRTGISSNGGDDTIPTANGIIDSCFSIFLSNESLIELHWSAAGRSCAGKSPMARVKKQIAAAIAEISQSVEQPPRHKQIHL
jgi:hypothetical protein